MAALDPADTCPSGSPDPGRTCLPAGEERYAASPVMVEASRFSPVFREHSQTQQS